MTKKSKTQRKEELRLRQEREEVVRRSLQFSTKRFKKFHEVITQLYNGEDLRQFFTTDRRMWKIDGCFENVSKKNDLHAKAYLRDIFIYLDKYSLLTGDEALINAVYNAFDFRIHWRNDILEWKPVNKQASFQFMELANYLFCKYEIPDFLYKAFYETDNALFIHWFIHLGTGGRVIEMKDIPIHFT